jgi:DNA-binding response OmpR family regulator
VLCVDDETPILRTLGRLLGRLDCEVDAASTLGEIKARLTGLGTYDLVILDRQMPEIAGEDLAMQVRAQRPELPIAMCSGGDGELIIPTGGAADYQVPKPFDTESLSAVVDAVRRRRFAG